MAVAAHDSGARICSTYVDNSFIAQEVHDILRGIGPGCLASSLARPRRRLTQWQELPLGLSNEDHSCR
jgi:hypothetical protein